MQPMAIFGLYQLINCNVGKSKKDFKPKAPLRRPAGPASGQSSVRGSVEPQVLSQRQTPRIQATNPAEQPSISIEARFSIAQDENSGAAGRQVRKSRTPELPRLSSYNNSPAVTRSITTRSDTAGFQDATITTPRLQDADLALLISVSNTPRPRTNRYDSKPAEPRTSGLQSLEQSPDLSDTRASSKALPKRLGEQTPEVNNENAEPLPKRRRLNATQVAECIRDKTPALSFEASSGQTGKGQHPYTPSPQPGISRIKQGAKARSQNVVEGSVEDPVKSQAKKEKNISRLRKKIVASTVEHTPSERSEAKRSGRRPRKRAKTPPNAESVEIAANDVRMAELCQDNHAGKKSNREARLAKREKEAKAAKARKQLRELVGETEDTPARGSDEAASSQPQKSQLEHPVGSPEPVPRLAPQVRLVNGQIVQDEGSRLFDRHAAAEGSREDMGADVQEEDELTRRVNSASYQKRLPSFRWTVDMTERFYEGLRYFGTDFMMMTVLFPGVTRRQLKSKFVKEERQDEALVKQILLHERKVADLEELQRLANVVYRDPEDVQKEMEEDRKRLEEEDRLEREAREQLERRRVEEVDREGRNSDGTEHKRDRDNAEQGHGAEDEVHPGILEGDRNGALAGENLGDGKAERISSAGQDHSERRSKAGKQALKRPTVPRRTRRNAASAA